MLSVLRVLLPSQIPVAGCELAPFVLLGLPDSTTTTEDIPEASPVDGFYLRCRWYRIQSEKRVAVCSVHPAVPATLQCLGCVKANLAVAKSYHCSSKCFTEAWRLHRAMHVSNDNGGDDDDPIFGRAGTVLSSHGGLAALNGQLPPPSVHSSNARISPARISPAEHVGGETWFEVGRGKSYSPSAEDVGHRLQLECVAVEATTARPVGRALTVFSSHVIPAPSPTPRRFISVNPVNGMSAMEIERRIPAPGTFTLLSYNVLADLYATSDKFSYCPHWALSWAYRKQNLLREIVSYRADILCLQEVQSDHFEEFFAPELERHGYAAVYKKKAEEVYTGTSYAIDGCATFFRRDRFSLVKKYEVEFNKAAQSLSDAFRPSASRRAVLSRLLKDNVALIIVLEARDTTTSFDSSQAAGQRQLVCVANTHIHSNPELKDVKVWQVHTLLKGLERIAASATIPMLVAGDFNSVPGSAPYSLLTTGRVDAVHPELGTDPLGILRPASKLYHQLPLVSAYSQFARMQGKGQVMEQQRRRIDATTSEPLFTNCTKDFLGTLDYIFYTADSLVVESLLELLDQESLRKVTALPSPEWSSDHIALLAEFRFKSRPAH